MSLLGKDSTNKMLVGDTTTVFWSDRKTQLEDDFRALFALPSKDESKSGHSSRASAVSESADWPDGRGIRSPVLVLGLAPNAARLSVRFWHHSSVVGDSAKHPTAFR